VSDLRKAAEAVLERWDSPAWEWMKQGPTAELMATLRAALAAPRPEPVFDGQSGHPVMLPRAPVPVLGLISDEVRAALKAADAVESQEAYRTRAVAPDDAEALRRDAERLKAENERLRGLLAEAKKAVWMNYDGDLLDRIEAALKEVPR